MANAQAGDRFVIFMLRTVWTSLKLGFLADNLSLYHVNHVARPQERNLVWQATCHCVI